MNRLEAPALRGNTALGFLAAVGVVALSEQECIKPVRLAWEGRNVPLAVFVSEEYATVEELAGDLRKVAEELAGGSKAIPGTPQDFPYEKRRNEDTATGVDPMRMSRAAATATYQDAARDWAQGDRWFGRWLVALLAQHALDSKQAEATKGNRSGGGAERQEPAQGAVRLTPFNVGFGQMKFRKSFFDETLKELLKIPNAPLDAFRGWQRVEQFTGGKLEHGALRGATVATDGKPRNVASPSPTWLAVMGFRMFPLADDGTDVRAAGWQRVLVDPAATRRSLVWPIWRDALTPAAIRVLIDHPALRLEERQGRLVLPGAHSLAGLGLTAVFGASRRTESQGDGPIGPARLLWPAAGRSSGRG